MVTNNMCQEIVNTILEPVHFSRGVIQMLHGDQIDVSILGETKKVLRTFYDSGMVPMKTGDIVYIRKCPDCGIEALHKTPDIESCFAWRFYTLLYHH